MRARPSEIVNGALVLTTLPPFGAFRFSWSPPRSRAAAADASGAGISSSTRSRVTCSGISSTSLLSLTLKP